MLVHSCYSTLSDCISSLLKQANEDPVSWVFHWLYFVVLSIWVTFDYLFQTFCSLLYFPVCFPCFLPSLQSSQPQKDRPCCVCLCVCLTLTRSSGNCPREFSGTLIGGMTQSLFTRLRVPSPLTTTLRHGNKISGTCWVSVASPGFTCRDSKQASCIFSSGLHTHRAQGRLVTQGISDLIPVAWINALIIVCLINDHHLSACVGVCVSSAATDLQWHCRPHRRR